MPIKPDNRWALTHRLPNGTTSYEHWFSAEHETGRIHVCAPDEETASVLLEKCLKRRPQYRPEPTPTTHQSDNNNFNGGE